MSESITIAAAVMARLQTTPGIGAVVWPNTAAPATVPRYEVDAPGASHMPMTFAGQGRLIGIVVVTCVVKAGTGATADAMVQTIQERFPAHTTVGTAHVAKMPEPQTGYPDGDEFRVPVVITYRAFV